MVTSLWELRKRPLPPLSAVVPPPPAVPPVVPPVVPPAVAVSTTMAPVFQCRYRRGQCTRPRTRKRNGTLHSLCAVHRDRSIANQRRFDEKKRQETKHMNEAQVKEKQAARAKQRRDKYQHTTNARAAPAAPSPDAAMALLSFSEFKTKSLALPRTTRCASDAHASPIDPDATRTWLLPFQLHMDDANERDADVTTCADVTWATTAVEQFLQRA